MSFMQVYDSVQETVSAVFQEILVLVLFAASFYIWKSIAWRFRARRAPPKYLKRAPCGEPFPTKGAKHVPEAGPSRKPGQKQVQEAQEQILRLLGLREFTTALNMYRAFEREGLDRHFTSEDMYGGFIQSAVRVGKLDVVERMLRLMLRNEVSPSIEFWHTTMKMLSSRKHFSTCLEIYAAHEQALPNDKVIFSCLINAALESGKPKIAVPMLKRYEQCGLEPSDYVTVFRAYVALGDVNKAVNLLEELKSSITPLMLNLVLLTCVNANQPERAMNVLSEAHRYAAGNCSSRSNPVDSKRCSIVDAISYNTVIKGFVANGNFDGCIDCLRRMQACNLKPDDVTLTSLLDISFTDKSHALTDQLVELLVNGGRDQTLDAGTCNVFIKGLVKEERLHKAIEVYDAMRSCSGCQPNIVTYSITIKALVDGRDLKRALLVIEDMVSRGLPPDEIIFTHLLEGCRVSGNHALGERIFDDMIAAGLKPSEYTLTMMVKLRGRFGAHKEAYELVAAWKDRYGQEPSVIHYTCLMSGCLRSKQYDQAWAAYELMERRGVPPDEVLLATLLPAMAASGHPGRVLTLARRALRRPGKAAVPAEALRGALAALSLAPGAEREARELEGIMGAAGVSARCPKGTARRAPWRREALEARAA